MSDYRDEKASLEANVARLEHELEYRERASATRRRRTPRPPATTAKPAAATLWIPRKRGPPVRRSSPWFAGFVIAGTGSCVKDCEADKERDKSRRRPWPWSKRAAGTRNR